MAEQFLQTAQIGAASEQMRRKTVAQRMRRRAFGQPQRAPRRPHTGPHDPGCQRPAARAEKQTNETWPTASGDSGSRATSASAPATTSTSIAASGRSS